MKFNISYMGPLEIQHLRRDFMLAIKYGLEESGHDVMLTGQRIDPTRQNILICPNWLNKKSADQLLQTKIKYIAVNTEIIVNGTLNYRPEKTDFNGVFLPLLRNAQAVWDVVHDNLDQYAQYGLKAEFLRWGYTPKLQEIEHTEKVFDFYFFGSHTQRRIEIMRKMVKAGLKGESDDQCPTFMRNDKIARAKVNLCLSQDDKFNHVPSFRTCYLSNNDCLIVSEPLNDPANYLDSACVVKTDQIIEFVKANKDKWKELGAENCEKFKTHRMKHVMAELLEHSLG